MEPDVPLTTPGKTSNRVNKKVNIDSLQRNVLHNIICNFHLTHETLFMSNLEHTFQDIFMWDKQLSYGTGPHKLGHLSV